MLYIYIYTHSIRKNFISVHSYVVEAFDVCIYQFDLACLEPGASHTNIHKKNIQRTQCQLFG